MLKGCWQLTDFKGNPVNLYTLTYAEVFHNKINNKDYKRGKWCLFETKLPELVDKNPNFTFIRVVNGRVISGEDVTKEIAASVSPIFK